METIADLVCRAGKALCRWWFYFPQVLRTFLGFQSGANDPTLPGGPGPKAACSPSQLVKGKLCQCEDWRLSRFGRREALSSAAQPRLTGSGLRWTARLRL